MGLLNYLGNLLQRNKILFTIIFLFSTVAIGQLINDAMFTVDNLRLDGNTLSSQDTNGDINLTPDGTGNVIVTPLSTGSRFLESGANGEVLESGLTTTEGDQLENIDSVTVSNAQWGYLGAMDQDVDTSANPSFNTLSLTGFGGSTGVLFLNGSNAVSEDTGDFDYNATTNTLSIENIDISGNDISSSDTNGDITITPDGTGNIVGKSTILASLDGNGDGDHTIGGASVTSGVEVHAESDADLAGMTVHRHANTMLNGGHFLALRSRNTHASPTIVQNGDVILRHAAGAYDGTDYQLLAEIRAIVDGTPGNNDMPGALLFRTTADGSGSPTTQARINQNGNLNLLTENELRLQDSSGGEYVGFKAPSTVSTSVTYILPDEDGTNNQVLSTNGSGTLSWKTDSTAASDLSVSTKTANYTVTTSDDLILCDTSSNDVTLTLYTASGNSGKQLRVKVTDATNDCIIDGNSTETIDGRLTYTLDELNEVVTVASDNSNWQAIHKYEEWITRSIDFNCSSGSTIAVEQGDWVSSIGNISSRECAITLHSGIFSSEPVCQLSISDGSNNEKERHDVTSATAITVGCENVVGTTCASSWNGTLTCFGPRGAD